MEDILGNSGSSMYFKAFDYEKRTYKEINIRYIDNKVVYLESGVRRTSYYLTDEGYNMMLSTMEMENNLKLSVHEMLFISSVSLENRARRSRRQSCRSGEMRWLIQ